MFKRFVFIFHSSAIYLVLSDKVNEGMLSSEWILLEHHCFLTLGASFLIKTDLKDFLRVKLEEYLLNIVGLGILGLSEWAK